MSPVSRSIGVDQAPAITPAEYGRLHIAIDHFNTELFDGALPAVFVILNTKSPRAYGHFVADRFTDRVDGGRYHEVALNPDYFTGQTDRDICQTIVHELAHCWQREFGKPSRAGYHNKAWAKKMKSIGLHPSNNGLPGGKETGQQMLDYVVPGGRFEEAFNRLAQTGWKLHLQSDPSAKKSIRANSSKVKFLCPGDCGQSFSGKPDLMLKCGICDFPMRALGVTDTAIGTAPFNSNSTSDFVASPHSAAAAESAHDDGQ